MNRYQIIGGTLAVCTLFSGTALAEKWYFEPVFDITSKYDDNVRLTTSDEEDAFSTHLTADARYGFRTEVSDVRFQTQLKSHLYDGLDDLDYNEALQGVDAKFRRNLDIFSLKASLLRDSSRVSELETSGFVRSSIPRLRSVINPSWSRQVSERTLLRVDYSHTDVSYSNTSGTNLIDYRYDSGSIGLNYKLSEKVDLQTSLLANRYKAEDIYSKFESYGAQIGLSRRFDETFEAAVAVGLTHTDSFFINSGTGLKDEDSDVSPLLSVSFKKKFESTEIDGALTTSESPGGSGRVVRKNSLSLNLSHKLTERMNFSVRGQYFRNESSGGLDNPNDERTYFSIEPKISWRASRWWTVAGSYRYRTQEYTESDNGAADSNAVYLSVHYVWPRPSYSRHMTL
jgi:hypothetical protein